MSKIVPATAAAAVTLAILVTLAMASTSLRPNKDAQAFTPKTIDVIDLMKSP
jgi:hypothetical protein